MPIALSSRGALKVLSGVAAALLLSGSGTRFAADLEGPVLAACEAPEAEPSGRERTREAPAGDTVPDLGHRALVAHLSRRYLIAAEALERVVATAHTAAGKAGLDPLLVLAVIGVESRYNPVAESPMGAKGLMQIIPKYHRATLGEHGGEQAVLDPRTNILVGSRILQEYVERTGSLEAGLQFYNGAFWDGSARYARRVMAERGRLEQVLRAEDST
jgi:hypothetical protein